MGLTVLLKCTRFLFCQWKASRLNTAYRRAGPFIPHWFFDPTLALSIGCYNLPKSQRSTVLDKGSVAASFGHPSPSAWHDPFSSCNCVRNWMILWSDKEFLYRNRRKIVYHPILSETVRKIIPEKILMQKSRKVHEFARKRNNQYICICRKTGCYYCSFYLLQNWLRTIAVNKIDQ